MGEDANADQIEYWNEVSGPKWVAMQEDLDSQLVPLMEALLEFANAQPGDSILDVGCGCGASTLAFAEIVGAEGRVEGLDVSRPMLDHARARTTAAGLEHISFVQGDAQVAELAQGGYDHVVSRFGIMFFDDPAAAFANLRSALKPGGDLVFICWRPITENPWMTIPAMAAAQHLEMPGPPEPNAPGPFGLADELYTRGQLESGGFTDVTIEPFTLKMHAGPGGSLEASAEFSTKIGPVSALLRDADQGTVAKVKASIVKALRAHEGEDGVKLDFATWLVRARV